LIEQSRFFIYCKTKQEFIFHLCISFYNSSLFYLIYGWCVFVFVYVFLAEFLHFNDNFSIFFYLLATPYNLCVAGVFLDVITCFTNDNYMLSSSIGTYIEHHCGQLGVYHPFTLLDFWFYHKNLILDKLYIFSLLLFFQFFFSFLGLSADEIIFFYLKTSICYYTYFENFEKLFSTISFLGKYISNEALWGLYLQYNFLLENNFLGFLFFLLTLSFFCKIVYTVIIKFLFVKFLLLFPNVLIILEIWKFYFYKDMNFKFVERILIFCQSFNDWKDLLFRLRNKLFQEDYISDIVVAIIRKDVVSFSKLVTFLNVDLSELMREFVVLFLLDIYFNIHVWLCLLTYVGIFLFFVFYEIFFFFFFPLLYFFYKVIFSIDICMFFMKSILFFPSMFLSIFDFHAFYHIFFWGKLGFSLYSSFICLFLIFLLKITYSVLSEHLGKKGVFVYKVIQLEYLIVLNLLFFMFLICVLVRDYLLLLCSFEIIVMLLIILMSFKKEITLTKSHNQGKTFFSNYFFSITVPPLVVESMLKYLFANALNTFFFLFFLLMLLSVFNGNLDFASISFYFDQLYQGGFNGFLNNFFMIALVSFFIYFFFKLGLFPTHWWVADVFQGIGYLPLWLISGPFKFLVGYIMIIQFGFLLPYFSQFFVVINIVFIICSLLVSSFAIIRQHNIKRFLAFSSINNMSFFLVPLLLNSFESSSTSFLYMIFYILSITLLFICLLVSNFHGKYSELIYIEQFKYIYSQNKILIVGFLTSFLSLAGLPPFVGFWGKFLVLREVYFKIHTSFVNDFYTYNFWQLNFIWVLLLFSLIISSIIMAYAYLRIIKVLLVDASLLKTKAVFKEALINNRLYKLSFHTKILVISFVFLLFFLTFFFFFHESFIRKVIIFSLQSISFS
jgi:NADH:ubiquinone oxidoreductase subunit 2 (subunit N)